MQLKKNNKKNSYISETVRVMEVLQDTENVQNDFLHPVDFV